MGLEKVDRLKTLQYAVSGILLTKYVSINLKIVVSDLTFSPEQEFEVTNYSFCNKEHTTSNYYA